nr:hypothetical protein BgiMline_011568 [Biomphalaria glabrata]
MTLLLTAPTPTPTPTPLGYFSQPALCYHCAISPSVSPTLRVTASWLLARVLYISRRWWTETVIFRSQAALFELPVWLS